MANLSLRQDYTDLIAQWIEAQKNGEEFPVPLHDNWQIAGHRNRQDAFALAESRLEKGFDFLGLTLKTSSSKGGRPRKALFLSVADFARGYIYPPANWFHRALFGKPSKITHKNNENKYRAHLLAIAPNPKMAESYAKKYWELEFQRKWVFYLPGTVGELRAA